MRELKLNLNNAETQLASEKKINSENMQKLKKAKNLQQQFEAISNQILEKNSI